MIRFYTICGILAVMGLTSFAFRMGFRRLNKKLDKLGLLLGLLTIGSAQYSRADVNLYAAPGATGNNSGSDTNNCLELMDALRNHNGPNVTVWLVDGLYNAGKQQTYSPLGTYQFYNTSLTAAHPMTVKAINPGKAIIAYGTAGGISASTYTDTVAHVSYVTPGVIFDGLQVCSNRVDGIGVAYGSIVRNCWVHDNTQQGINSSSPFCHDNLFEFNVLERNGSDMTYLYHYHNAYIYGANNIFRNNVSRWDGGGHGVIFYSETDSLTSGTNNLVYNNLIYGNTNGGYGISVWSGTLRVSDNTIINPGTNYVFDNTILDSILLVGGWPCLTNNIILPSPGVSAIQLSGANPPTVFADYNLGTNTLRGSAHEVVTTWSALAFVNFSQGLLWLSAGSSARNVALATIRGTNDFFGSTISTYPDIGAVLYDSGHASDVRNLDTGSGTVAPPYFAKLTCTGPSITVQPQSQSAIVHNNVTWTITATGDAPLTYYWYWNGGLEQAGSSNSLVSPNVLLTDNGAQVTCVVSNQCGTVTSSAATLTVNPSLPAAPTGLIITAASGTSISLSWTASTDLTVTDYKVYYGSVSRTYTSTVDTGSTATTRTVTGLDLTKVYYFAVTAISPSGESVKSNEVVFNPLPVVQNFQAGRGAAAFFSLDPSGW